MNKYWPFYIGFDLVLADVEQTADAVENELNRFFNNQVTRESIKLKTLADVFSKPNAYTSFPTEFFVVPTKSPWTLLWCNTFHCNGYDSLCYCITQHSQLETIHYTSCDHDAFYQAGSQWHHRVDCGTERVISAIRNDTKWDWFSNGELQSYENEKYYENRIIKKRFNNHIVNEYLDEIGFNPMHGDIDSNTETIMFCRTDDTSNIEGKDFDYILSRCSQQNLS